MAGAFLVARALSSARAVSRTSYGMWEPRCTTARPLGMLSQVVPMREISKFWRVMMVEQRTRRVLWGVIDGSV